LQPIFVGTIPIQGSGVCGRDPFDLGEEYSYPPTEQRTSVIFAPSGAVRFEACAEILG